MRTIASYALMVATVLGTACASSTDRNPSNAPVSLTSGSPLCKQRNAECQMNRDCCGGNCDYDLHYCH
jgi:hypothetical protein